MAGISTLNDALRRLPREVAPATRGVRADNRDLTSGADFIIAPNYLKFVSVPPAVPFVVLFDSFVVQRVSSNRRDQIVVHYTNGAPLVDVMNTGPEIMTVTVTIPDTAPFFSTNGQGYLGESAEYFRALYDKYFRVAGAVGSKDRNATGLVEFWSKGRVTRGYLIRYALERTATAADVNELTFEMFVMESIATMVKAPVPEVV